MSIINDAIKKARKEFERKNRDVVNRSIRVGKPSEPSEGIPLSSKTKWRAIVVASLVLIASLLGSVILYKHMSKTNIAYDPDIPTANPEVTEAFTPIYKETVSSAVARPSASVELNGIVYGPKEKWAIINNRIAREGNFVPGGELILIAKDFVRIKKDNGEEIVLELR